MVDSRKGGSTLYFRSARTLLDSTTTHLRSSSFVLGLLEASILSYLRQYQPPITQID